MPNKLKNETSIISELLPFIKLSDNIQLKTIDRAKNFIEIIRNDKEFGIEKFMQQFSLSTEEGVAIMCLAEGLLRISDRFTAKAFAIDKLSNKNWKNYLLKSQSLKGGLTSFGLFVSGKFADVSNIDNSISKIITNMGQPIFLGILKQAIAFLSKEFIFGFNISDALKNETNYPKYLFAFDLLGESARTLSQAERYYSEYIDAIEQIANSNSLVNEDSAKNINLSVKLTALYPRIELAKKEDIENYLLPKLITLIKKVRDANLTITFDAEESKRLDIYLYILTKVICNSELQEFDGIGFVVQAYSTRAIEVTDSIIGLAKLTNKKIPIRLVKGAYWDYEIKYAQELGLESYPVFTKKEYTDCSYIACARKILENDEYIYPQFATHNALTAATIIELARDKNFEFQKLHGMGKSLHEALVKDHNVRIYAPIGQMNDLLAYLMRRMLENGANACFVNQVNNKSIEIDHLSYNLHEYVTNLLKARDQFLLPKNIYLNRENAMGYNLGYKDDYDRIHNKVSTFYNKVHKIGSIIDGKELINPKHFKEHFCPAKIAEKFADISSSTESEIKSAITSSTLEFEKWSRLDPSQRADIIRKVADLYEENKFELYALLIKEAGKTINDAIGEVVEAIDFCRYYANQAEAHMSAKKLPSPTGESNILTMHPRGVFLCISPWNFPLAIFTGQIVAALVCGNTVIAKPADQTPVIANFAIKLMHKAGVFCSALQLIIASGSNIGKYVVTDERVAGVAFTGSTDTAKIINLTLAQRGSAIVPFIAETGGQNAMIVDSSSLLEQVTDDVLISAFNSSGQRCSALRMLYVQEEIYEPLVQMLREATELLKIGDNADFSTDIGPVINKESVEVLSKHINDMVNKGFRLLSNHAQKTLSSEGNFFYPHILEINSIKDIPDEKFGCILHVTKYKSTELDKVIEEINNCGFGLTFGIHSRIEDKINYISSRIKVGNIYANRSIIGAKVESQPFGGENKSGTGFKAGGPHYLLRFLTERTSTINLTAIGGNIELLRQDVTRD